MVTIPVWLLGRGPVHDKVGERNRVQFLFFFSLIFLKKFCYSNINWWERTRGHAKGEGRSETLKNKPTKENCKEINNEPQNNVTLRKVGAGKATGRACRLKWEQNGGPCNEQNGASNQNASVSVCVCVCVWERERERGRREEGGIKRRWKREQAGKQAYIRELEGFQETARS